MNGLMQSNMQQPSQQSNSQMQSEKTPQEGATGDQGAYEKVVLAGAKVLYDDQTHDAIMQTLQAGKDNPARALSNVVSNIITQLNEKAGGKIPQQVILPAASELLSMVTELAEASGLFQPDDKITDSAYMGIVKSMIEKYPPPPEDVNNFLNSLNEEDIQKGAQPGATQ